MISGHGDDSHQYSQTILADFSSNVWFGGTSPELIEHLQKNLHLARNYPEPDAADLCRKMAGSYDVNPTQVLAFNGSVEAFYTIAVAFRGTNSAILYPAFSEYEDACRMHQHIPTFFRSDEAESALNSGINLFWIGNPNNPDGHIFSFQEIEQWLKKYPKTVLVIDEAYAAFIPDFQSAIPLTKTYPNLIVVRSLTKYYAIPGLRLGYVVASEKLAERLRRFQQPWSVNVLAQEAGKFIFDYPHQFFPDTSQICQLSCNFQKAVSQFLNFRVIPSKAPFFLIEMQSGTAKELKEFLVHEYGILIRDASNFQGLNEQYFRVCTRDEKDNQLLISGLFEWNLNSLR
jgi:threonine-phosphate decarboxylase